VRQKRLVFSFASPFPKPFFLGRSWVCLFEEKDCLLPARFCGE
jgi:hypothetical protein